MSETPIESVNAAASSAAEQGEPTTPWDDLATVLRHAREAKQAENSERAHAFFVRATELDPNSAEAWEGRAGTNHDLDDAIISWAYARALAPDNERARIGLEQCIGAKIQNSGAADIASLLALGHAIAEVGQKPWAFRLFKRASELDDTNEEAWVWRAGLTDDSQEMISCLRRALALNPDNAQAQEGLKWALAQQTSAPPVEQGKDSTVDPIEQAAKLVQEGQELLQIGDKARAHELFKRATELDPKNEHAWLWRGSTTLEVDEALTCMEQALAINPENQSAKEARSWLRVKKLRESAKAQRALTPPPPPSAQRRIPIYSAASWKQNRGVLFTLAVIVLLVLLLVLLLRIQ